MTRGVRWDSDHVVLFEDELKEIAKEIVRNNALDKVMIGPDYFDASINRLAAWVVGARNMQKALLDALLLPHYTHYGKSKENKVFKGDDLEKAINVLRVLLEFHICKLLNIDKTDQVKEFLNRYLETLKDND